MSDDPKPKMIKIRYVPNGEAPIWVREAWVGLLLPINQEALDEQDEIHLVEIFSGSENIAPHYLVDSVVAVNLLRQQNQIAAEWWFKYFDFKKYPNLWFSESCGFTV
jgi:hypothetical protein